LIKAWIVDIARLSFWFAIGLMLHILNTIAIPKRIHQMARGLGKVQLSIIAQLSVQWHPKIQPARSAVDLACGAYGVQPQAVTQSQLVAVRKALHALRRYYIVVECDHRSLRGERLYQLTARALEDRKLKPVAKSAGLSVVK
jgi:hypothetical protein